MIGGLVVRGENFCSPRLAKILVYRGLFLLVFGAIFDSLRLIVPLCAFGMFITSVLTLAGVFILRFKIDALSVGVLLPSCISVTLFSLLTSCVGCFFRFIPSAITETVDWFATVYGFGLPKVGTPKAFELLLLWVHLSS